MLRSSQTEDGLKYHYYFSLTVVFAVLLRVLFSNGPSGADDIIYFEVIEKLLLNNDVGTTISSSVHWGTRLGLIFPVWFFMKIFGVSTFTTALFSMMTSIGTLFFIYIIGIRLFNHQVALLSAMFFSILPQDVQLAGVLYPDGPVVIFSVIFIYLHYELSSKENVAIKQSLIAGFILGVGYYMRETSVIVLLIVPLLFFNAPNKKNFLISSFFVGCGLGLAIGIEWGVFGFFTGEPFTRINILVGESKVFDPLPISGYQARYRNSNFLLDPFIVIFATHWIASLMVSLVVGVSILIVKKKKEYKFFSLGKGHFLWMTILTFSILTYYCYGPIYGLTMPLKRSVRYYHTVTPFLALLFGVIIYELCRQKGITKVSGYSIAVFYVATSFFSMGSIVNKHSHGIDLMDDFISKNPAENYIMPQVHRPILKMNHGLNFLEGKIITYSLNEGKPYYDAIPTFLSEIRKGNSVQYLFYFPDAHEIQYEFTEYIKWPLEQLDLVTVMSTSLGMSCRIIKSNAFVFSLIPIFFRSKICYTADVGVYKLK